MLDARAADPIHSAAALHKSTFSRDNPRCDPKREEGARMKIVLCEASEHPHIAYEELDGSREGDFFLDDKGIVRYAHPADGHVWFVAPDPTSFRVAVEYWIGYLDGESRSQAVGRTAALDTLRTALTRLDLLPDRPDALWPVLLEQAEAGLL